MDTLVTIVVSVIIFGVIVIAHEFGHFIVAKKSGVVVEEFAVGMGPVLFKKQGKTTLYSVRAIPIGGFCQMKGETEETDEDGNTSFKDKEGSFYAASPFKRILILIAGSAMNFIVAILLFMIIICSVGNVATTTISSVGENTNAYAMGVTQGDTILSVDGTILKNWDELEGLVNRNNGQQISLQLESKDGSIRTVKITPYLDEESGVYKIGVTPKTKVNLFKALISSLESVGMYVVLIFRIFGMIFGGEISAGEAFSGPIGAAVIIGQTIPMGFIYVLNIAASISISLGVMNMFPIPSLDGSKIIFTAIEWIKGSPVNPKIEGTLTFIGFAAMLLLAAVIAYKDIVMFF